MQVLPAKAKDKKFAQEDLQEDYEIIMGNIF